jgi:hypothetical protein
MNHQTVIQLRKGEQVTYENRTYVVITDWLSSDCNRVCLREVGLSEPRYNFSVQTDNPWWEKVELDYHPKWKRDRPFVMWFTEYADGWQGYTKHPNAQEPLYSRGATYDECAKRLVQGISRQGWMLPFSEYIEHKTNQLLPRQ